MPKGGHLALKTYNFHLKQRYDGQIESIPAGRYVCLEAEDSGCGISSEVLPHIVEPFFTTKEFGKGTGLGLATVYGIIKQYQGYLDVKSKTGQGSTFFIYFQPFQDTPSLGPTQKAIRASLRV
jgi:signal transduction histidine kinase